MSLAPVILLILDGWGQAAPSKGNAVSLAATPHLDAIKNHFPPAFLTCSGRDVGLPQGFMGNSEVGHINIGAGRIVYQDITRIDLAFEDGSINSNQVLMDVFSKVKGSGGNLHLMGLLSDGGVHSHINHLEALLSMAHERDIPTLIHVFTDGRDTAPRSGRHFAQELLRFLPNTSKVASVSGRYYAMDRDHRWERTEKAWNAIVHGKGERADTLLSALDTSYAQSTTDEFILPTIMGSYDGMKSGDAILMFNFRSDRMRSLAHVFCDSPFTEFNRGEMPKIISKASMTQYEAGLSLPFLFDRQNLEKGLGETLSNTGCTQLRIAETEKYAHVTYFFNGGREEPFTGEDRCLIPSPRDVSTYDEKPEMSAEEVTDKLLMLIDEKHYDLIVCNFANMDMVGHTGNIPAAIVACESVDACVGRINEVVRSLKGVLIITADHGNAEEMLLTENQPQTAHSKNPVPFVLADYRKNAVSIVKQQGKLGDIAPTILSIMQLDVPQEMTGTVLCESL